MSDIALTVSDPFVGTGVLALGAALATRLFLRRYPQWSLAGHLLLLALMTLVFLRNGVVPYAPMPGGSSLLQRSLVGFAKIVWWTNAAWALVGVVRVFLVFERRPREGRLVQDLIVGLIYVGAILSVIAYVFDAPVGTLFATSGVLAIILGLAMQSTLGDVFSGLALSFGQSYAVGDRIALDDVTGQVIETNWRATHLLSDSNDLVILPNSTLAKARLTNLSHPERSHGIRLTVRLAPSMNPGAMADVLRGALLGCTAILPDPPPAIVVRSMDAFAIALDIYVRVADAAHGGGAASELYDLVYRHVRAAGLSLGPPEGSAVPAPPVAPAGDPRPTALRLLDALALFAVLTEDERETLAVAMTRRAFRKGEVLAQQDAALPALMILRSGTASVVRHDGARTVELGRLAPGDIFGERGLLTGTGELGEIRALTFVVAYAVSQESFGTLMRERPAIADELGAILARRTQGERALTAHFSAATEPTSAPHIVERIRALFRLPERESS